MRRRHGRADPAAARCDRRRRSPAARRAGRAVARAKAAIRSGSRRRLKSEPTKSTSGSRRLVAAAPDSGRVTPGGMTRSAAASTPSRVSISRRENSESVNTTAARVRGAPRQPAPPQAFARTEPFRVRDERDVVDRHRQRHRRRRAARCRPARRRRRANRRITARRRCVCSHHVPRPDPTTRGSIVSSGSASGSGSGE